ncbi:transposase [Oxalobacteraceae sp. CFBP 8753]|nr:transposase [Oxalobacteraceae sp. CFBP 8753]
MPSSPFLGALAYIRERRVGLSVYLDDPEVSIDTNHLERALRVIPMGKKNWLFSWTELGAKHTGIVQSLLATRGLPDINPYDYLVDVLQRVGQHPASLVHQLTIVHKSNAAPARQVPAVYRLCWICATPVHITCLVGTSKYN